MDIATLLKAGIGFLIVLVVQLLACSRYYYLAALVPLFPSMALFSYYFVGGGQSRARLEETIIFGMVSLLTYFSFLLALLIAVRHFQLRIVPALLVASLVWCLVAAVQIQLWPWLRPLLVRGA